MSQTLDGLKIYSFSGVGLLVLASEHNKAIAALEQQNAELLAAARAYITGSNPSPKRRPVYNRLAKAIAKAGDKV